MKVAGIVAEFNPFHRGHERIISYCREELGADAVIVCMSGNFVQRGEPAIIDKYARAYAAVHSADLVLELPVIGATANAEIFAKTGVNTLLSTGIVTDLVFGSESMDETAIENAARLLADEPEEFRTALQEGMKAGLSYPAAMAKAAAACRAATAGKKATAYEAAASVFANPNDLLGVLYVKALLEFENEGGAKAVLHESQKAGGRKIAFHAVKRIGASHDAVDFQSGNSASAAAIRKQLATGTGISEIRPFLPPSSFEILSKAKAENSLVFPDDLSMLLHEKIYSAGEMANSAGNAAKIGTIEIDSNPDLTIFSDIDCDLANRIVKKREAFTTFSEFAELLDTRNYTRARLRRALLHIVLGITDNAVDSLKACNYSPYIHVLAMNEVGAGLLRQIKSAGNAGANAENTVGYSVANAAGQNSAQVPLFCALSEPSVKALSSDAAAVLQKDIFANDLYNIILTNKNGKPRKREASRKVLKL